MRFHVLTLFPEMIEKGAHNSILARAMDRDLIGVEAVNIRDYTQNKHGRVDDYIYGGGASYDEWTRAYMEGLAYIDRRAAAVCDQVIEVAAGQKIYYK